MRKYLLLFCLNVFFSCEKPVNDDNSDIIRHNSYIPTIPQLYCGLYQTYKVKLDSGSWYTHSQQSIINRIAGTNLLKIEGFFYSDVTLTASVVGNNIIINKQTVPFKINPQGEIDSVTMIGTGEYFPRLCEFIFKYEVKHQKLDVLNGNGRYECHADDFETYGYSIENSELSASISSIYYTITNVKYYPDINSAPLDSIEYDLIYTKRQKCCLVIYEQPVINKITGKTDTISGAVVSYNDNIRIVIERKGYSNPWSLGSITIVMNKNKK